MSQINEKEFLKLVKDQWPAAQAHWSNFLLLSDPNIGEKMASVAQINLGSRQVSLNFKEIKKKHLFDCLEALLAHEVGHHVRYPGTLAADARMRLLEKSLIPIEDYSVTNLFTDLMINERLGVKLKNQFVKVYQAFAPELEWRKDPAFIFYLAIYEELWQLAPGELIAFAEESFARQYPQYRAEANMVSEKLFRLGPNLYTQFIYFASILSQYIQPQIGDLPVNCSPYQCSDGQPGPDDWAAALTPDGRENEAIRRALQEGWISPEQVERMNGKNRLERRIASLPGNGSFDAENVPEIMAAYYRQQAERYLFRPPPQWTLGEAVVPTTLDPWEAGDTVRDIDWLSTFLQKGELLGSAEPLKRNKIADYEGYDVGLWQPRVEIYLDVSGSMPDPRMTRNAMTLAALILATGAIRAGGWARALLYSGDYVDYWQWCRSELELSRFLMHYIGGGTDYPFGKLADSLQECGNNQPIRAIITDTDFDHNYNSKKLHADILAAAGRKSDHLIMLLHQPETESCKIYQQAGAKIVRIGNLEDFPRMAADLSHALFTEKRYVNY